MRVHTRELQRLVVLREVDCGGRHAAHAVRAGARHARRVAREHRVHCVLCRCRRGGGRLLEHCKVGDE